MILTEDERQTLELMCEGHSTDTIAVKLLMSRCGVKWRVQKIIELLQAENKTNAVYLYTVAKLTGRLTVKKGRRTSSWDRRGFGRETRA